jgi:hypothetical protein
MATNHPTTQITIAGRKKRTRRKTKFVMPVSGDADSGFVSSGGAMRGVVNADFGEATSKVVTVVSVISFSEDVKLSDSGIFGVRDVLFWGVSDLLFWDHCGDTVRISV